MPTLFAISITAKDYRPPRTLARGQSVPAMMEDAMRDSLGAVVADVKRQLPGKRLKANTKILYKRTPQGASARLVVGEGVPFAYVQAKYGTSPIIIRPKEGHKYLAIPLNVYAKGLQNKAGSLREYGNLLHPHWKGKGERPHPVLYYGKGNTPMFNLVHQAVVKPSVDLNEVNDNMRMTINAAFKMAFKDFDYGYVSLRRGG